MELNRKNLLYLSLDRKRKALPFKTSTSSIKPSITSICDNFLLDLSVTQGYYKHKFKVYKDISANITMEKARLPSGNSDVLLLKKTELIHF